MQFETVGPEANLLEAFVDDAESCLLFCDEEHPLACSHGVGQHIRDRLAFAGAWRPLQHERMTC